MSKMTAAARKVGEFLKRNVFYILIVLCIACVATIIALAVTGDFSGDDGAVVVNPDGDPGDDVLKPEDPDDDKEEDDDKEPVVEPLSFASPVNGSVSQEYSDSVLVWNPTLGQYQVHLGVDFTGDDLSVFAAERGTVSETGYDILNGYYVVVSHDEGYETRYYSLAENLEVEKGDEVTKGQLLGTMAATRGSESTAGNHLHFEMSKDGTDINPLEVLVLEEK